MKAAEFQNHHYAMYKRTNVQMQTHVEQQQKQKQKQKQQEFGKSMEWFVWDTFVIFIVLMLCEFTFCFFCQLNLMLSVVEHLFATAQYSTLHTCQH